jgi:hypothetical protein
MRTEILTQLEQQQQLQEKNDAELLRYRECDPAVLRAKGTILLSLEEEGIDI